MSQHGDIKANTGCFNLHRTSQQLGIGDDESPQAKATCLHSLSPSDPEHDRKELLSAKGEITEGTCRWILSTDEYKRWCHRGTGSKDILWICGGPGSGKTMLSIFLTAHLEHAANTRDAAQSHLVEKDLLLYFFCNRFETTKNSENAILRGLLFQAIRQRPSLGGYVQRVYESQGNDVFHRWTFEALWAALRALILGQAADVIPESEVGGVENCQIPVTYIIVDGLDECETASIRSLTRKISRLDEDRELGGRVKFMLISRETPAIRDSFAGRHLRLNLEEPKNAQLVCADVQRHIVQKVDEIGSPDGKHYSAELCTSVKDYLAEKSQGNFLWVSMAINELESQSRVEAWEHLSRLTPTLDAMYEWMIMQIPHRWRELSTKVLLWVTLAFRPLTVAELVVALDERRLGVVDHGTVRDCVSRSGQFLRISVDDTVHLIHQSARDYLFERLESSPSFFKDCVELNPFNLEEGHKLIASICIDNLRDSAQPRIRDPSTRTKGGKAIGSTTFSTSTPTALSDYAKEFWTDHVRNANELVLDIVDSNPQIFEENSMMRGILALEASKGFLTEDVPVLHYAAYHGFAPLVGRLLKKSWRNRLRARRLVAQRDGLGRTALHLAVHRRDNGPIVELLLNRGADLSGKDHAGATALDHAMKYGTIEMASFLADHLRREKQGNRRE